MESSGTIVFTGKVVQVREKFGMIQVMVAHSVKETKCGLKPIFCVTDNPSSYY